MKKGYTPNPYSRKHKGKPVKMGETAEASADYLEKEQWGKQREEKEYRTDPNNTKTEGRYKGVEITIDEVEAAVKKLRRSKAPGPDGIPVEAYKELGLLNLWQAR